MTTYRRAPITEAVFALQLRESLSSRDLERVRDRLKRRLPKVGERFEIQVEVGDKPAVKSDLKGYQMASEEGNDIVILEANNITTSRLAPYDDWSSFLARARRNFDELLLVNDHPTVVRMATRFINRIDIPSRLIDERPDLAQFFRGFIHLPPGLATQGMAFGWNISVLEAETGMRTNLLMTQEPSPLLEHNSFVLDIDVYQEGNIPRRFEEMWHLADQLRIAKNNVFEKMITPLVRDLLR